MLRVKKFNELNEAYDDSVDKDLIQRIIDKMKPDRGDTTLSDNFKESINEFNNKYTIKEYKRIQNTMGKQAWWIDIDIIQDCIDRMTDRVISDKYKNDLDYFLNNF